ncbi:MAG: ABC transporter ATP-binding protein [Chloroflexi bacterium]|nr:ABC transporter ATP-binding protein [Chloroflexota bacterium]
MNPILEAHNIRVTYEDQHALDVPELVIQEGEVFVVIGPNGAGKSTLLRTLAALQRPHRGALTFRGRPISWGNTLAYRRRIAVVLQRPLLLNTSVYRNVALGLYLRGIWGRRAREKVVHWLDQFRVGHLAQRNALELSGGEAQRVALARAFVLEPDILFLDESFTGLDMPTRQDLLTDLRRVLGQTQTTVFLVTHDREEARALADRVAVLMEGRIRQLGPVEEVFTRPVDEAVAAFVGVENRFPARVRDVQGEWVWVEVSPQVTLAVRGPAPQRREVLLCVRPEDIRLRGEKGPNTWPGHIEEVIPQGSLVRVHLRVGPHTWRVLLPRREWRQLRARAGASVFLDISPDDVHLIEEGVMSND